MGSALLRPQRPGLLGEGPGQTPKDQSQDYHSKNQDDWKWWEPYDEVSDGGAWQWPKDQSWDYHSKNQDAWKWWEPNRSDKGEDDWGDWKCSWE